MLVRQIAMKLSVKRGVKDIATLHRGMRKKKNMLRPAELRTCVISLRGYIYNNKKTAAPESIKDLDFNLRPVAY